MKIIVGCEVSQRVTKAFRTRGHEAYSCDLKPTEGNPLWHIQDDILNVLKTQIFELAILHPPCTYLTNTGNKWFRMDLQPGRTGALRGQARWDAREKAIEFFMKLVEAPVKRIVIENPVGVMSTRWRQPDQIIQPFYFGHPHAKRTCLWLKNVPRLVWKRDLFNEGYQEVEPDYYICANGKRIDREFAWIKDRTSRRGDIRSITPQEIAEAMADQWSEL